MEAALWDPSCAPAPRERLWLCGCIGIVLIVQGANQELAVIVFALGGPSHDARR